MTGTQGQGELLATAKARPIQNALINSYPDAMPDAILDLMSDTNSKGAASMEETPKLGEQFARQISVAEFTEVTMRAVARALEQQKVIVNPILIYGIIALPHNLATPVVTPGIAGAGGIEGGT